jgi:toluene monooxygenase system protein A
MALLKRSAWYDTARNNNWTPKYVSFEELYPRELSDAFDLPLEEWEKFDEPYKDTFRDYVHVQREKDAYAYSIRSALERSKLYDNAHPGWRNLVKAHYGGVSIVEMSAGVMQGRFARFSKSPAMRNICVLGALDEIRHAQIHFWFAYEHIRKDPQFDWAIKAYHTKNWVAISVIHMLDDLEQRDVVSSTIMINLIFEVAFTNLQFIGLAADAERTGDHTFAHFLQSIQTDEARHSQICLPVIRMMVRNGKKAEAQEIMEIAFWRMYRIFALVSGNAMDYGTPLHARERSFKEFMEEFVVTQFERQLVDLGLDRPWYWDIFLRDIETFHHQQHLGIWLWRCTLWWDDCAGVTAPERAWLEEKYPGWSKTYGRLWDVIAENIAEGRLEKTIPQAGALICNMSQVAMSGQCGDEWDVKDHYLDHEGKRYHFASEVDRWIFTRNPDRYKDYPSFTDRELAGEVPEGLHGFLTFMGLQPGYDAGTDAHDYSWINDYYPKEAAE